MFITARTSVTIQHLHSFKFTLVNKSHSQHSVAAIHCEGHHFLMLYACAQLSVLGAVYTEIKYRVMYHLSATLPQNFTNEELPISLGSGSGLILQC